MNEGKTILMNQLFAGSYLDEDTNIGHEAINLFKADDGQNYLYITPSGKVNDPEKVGSVFFVRNYSYRTTFEVVAFAPVVEHFNPAEASKISYGGATLEDIFGDNVYKGTKEDLETQVTFCAKEGVFVPKKRILLTIENEDVFPEHALPEGTVLYRLEIKNRKRLISEAMRTYFAPNDKPLAYDVLKRLTRQTDLWEKLEGSFTVKAPAQHLPSLIEIIGRVNDERAFSNLLAYYFRYSKKGFRKFAKDILNIPNMCDSYEVVRELRFRIDKSIRSIDIWAEDESNVIVIENKVRSGVHPSGKDGSQLEEYYRYAVEYAEENSKKARLFIFAPDYNQMHLDAFEDGDKYDLVTYGKLLEFFKKNERLFEGDRYFGEFLRGLDLHTKTVADLNREIMGARFFERIANAKLKDND